MKVVLCNGTFDPLHYGHVLHLQEARKLGDKLVVGLTSDFSVRKEKGKGRPMFHELQRMYMLKALRCVDDVLVVHSADEALRRVKPAVFVKGVDYIGKIQDKHVRYCHKHGIEIKLTATPKWSATKIGHELRSR